MTTTSTPTPTLVSILDETYGCGLGVFDPLPVLWASERLADIAGIEAAKKALKAANKVRDRLAIPVACFPYGHRLF